MAITATAEGAFHGLIARRGTKTIAVIAALLLTLLLARIAAPFVVERWVNRKLAHMGDYRGYVTDVDLFLWAGGYGLRDLTIVKTASNVQTPFVAMPRMDLTLQWSSLFHGRVVGDVVMHEPVLNLIESDSGKNEQLGTGVNWPQEIRDLFPFRLNRVEIDRGTVTFRVPDIGTNDSLVLRQLHFVMYNLTNVQERDTSAFADVIADGMVMGNTPVQLDGRIDPNEKSPTFDVDLSLERGRLVDVNVWLRKFLNVDAEGGVFSMYVELATAKGRFKGYVKPILEDPKIFDLKTDEGGPLHKAWEALVALAAKIFENRAKDQVATQIPLQGELENPEAGVLTAVVNLLRNAFVAAFAHSLEGSISFRDVAKDVRCLNEDDAKSGECD